MNKDLKELKESKTKEPLMPAYTGEEYVEKKHTKLLILLGLIGTSGLAISANFTLNGKNNIFIKPEWDTAFKDKETAQDFVRNEANYKKVMLDGFDYKYMTSSGSFNLFNNSGKKLDENSFIKDDAKLKEAFFKDLDVNKIDEGHANVHNQLGKTHWVPYNYSDYSRTGVWSHPSTQNLDTPLYNGSTLTQYFLGIDNGNLNNGKTYSTINSAINSLIETTGVNYTFDGQTFTDLDAVYNYFYNNTVTISDLSLFKQGTPYNASNGTNVITQAIFNTLTEAQNSVKTLSKNFEYTLISPYNWSVSDWETTTQYETNKNTWITNNTTTASGNSWMNWATSAQLRSYMGTKRYFEGVSDYSWNQRAVWTGSPSDSTIWRAFRAAHAFGRILFNSEYSTTANPTSAFTCNGNTVAQETPFITSFRQMWTEFGLHRARKFDTEVFAKLCEGGSPLYAEKRSGTTRGWREDFFFSPWLTDRLSVIVEPAGTPAYTPNEDDYRSSVDYTSKYNAWKTNQDKLGHKVWNGTKYNSFASAVNIINNVVDAAIVPGMFTTETKKQGEFSYPGSTVDYKYVADSVDKLDDLLEAAFYRDKRYTTQPGGTYKLKTGVNWNGIGINIAGVPATPTLSELEKFLTNQIDNKYGKPGLSATAFSSIVAYDHRLASRVVVYKDFNNSGRDVFHKVMDSTLDFNEHVWNNLQTYKFAIDNQTTDSREKIVLTINHTQIGFDTLEDAMAFWEREVA